MIKEFQAFFNLFKQGREVANPAAWKNGTIKVNAIAGLIGSAVVIAGGFGYDINLSEETINTAAAGVVALVGIVNAVMHVITSARVGLPPSGNSGDARGE